MMWEGNISGYLEYFYRAVSICNLTPCARGQRVKKTREREGELGEVEKRKTECVCICIYVVRMKKKGRRRNKDREKDEMVKIENERRVDLDKTFGYFSHMFQS